MTLIRYSPANTDFENELGLMQWFLTGVLAVQSGSFTLLRLSENLGQMFVRLMKVKIPWSRDEVYFLPFRDDFRYARSYIGTYHPLTIFAALSVALPRL